VLNAARDLYGYDYRASTPATWCCRRSLQTRMFHLNYLDLSGSASRRRASAPGQITQNVATRRRRGMTSRRPGRSETAARLRPAPPTSRAPAVVTENSSDFWESIAANLRAIIGAPARQGRRAQRRRQQSVRCRSCVRAMPNELRDVADYLAQDREHGDAPGRAGSEDHRGRAERCYQAGINWAAVLTQGSRQYFIGQSTPRGGFDGDLLVAAERPVPVGRAIRSTASRRTRSAAPFTLAADFADFNAFIELLGLQGRTRVLSSPRVSTIHNQKAVIKAGSDEFFVTGVSSDTTTGTATTTTVDVELTPFFSGVALDVTPQINDQGDVLMHIHPTVSDVTDPAERAVGARPGRIAAAGAQPDPRVGQHRARAQRPGHRDRRPDAPDAQGPDYKTPLLGDIPGLGRCSAASATRPAPRSW
jgi:MSHA biogenesis protein MshL